MIQRINILFSNWKYYRKSQEITCLKTSAKSKNWHRKKIWTYNKNATIQQIVLQQSNSHWINSTKCWPHTFNFKHESHCTFGMHTWKMEKCTCALIKFKTAYNYVWRANKVKRWISLWSRLAKESTSQVLAPGKAMRL